MINKSIFALLAIASATPFLSFGQDSEDEEAFELSPFTVENSDGRGYRATSTLAGSRVRTDLKDVGSAMSVVTDEFMRDAGATDNDYLLAYTTASEIGGISIDNDPSLRYANGVRIRFAIGFFDDKESARRKTLYTLLDKVREKVESNSGLYFDAGEMIVPQGDRKRIKGKKKSDYTAHAHFSISFDFLDQVSPSKRVYNVRRMVSELGIESDVTKIFFGNAQLTFSHSDPESSGITIPFARHVELGSTVSNVVDNNYNSIVLERPETPVSLVKTADAISIQFFANHFASLESDRIQTFDTLLDTVASYVASQSGQKFTVGNVSIMQGDQSNESQQKRSRYFSQAVFRIEFPINAETNARETIREIRKSVHAMAEQTGITQIAFGSANLVLKDPNQHRSEILNAINQDVELIKQGLGDEIIITPNVSNNRVKVSRYSDTEVELWIPYNIEKISLYERELEQQEIKLHHELALSKNTCSKKCCHDQPNDQ